MARREPGRDLVPAAGDELDLAPKFGWKPVGRLAQAEARPHPDDQLSAEAAELVIKGTPKKTRETYKQQWRKYVKWCGEVGRCELPASPATVIEYMNHLWRTPGRYGRPTAPSSVKLALAVIAVAHERARRPETDRHGRALYGYVSPTRHPEVRLARRGYVAQWLDAGHRPDTAYPLTPEQLSLMVGTLDRRTPMGMCDAVLLCIGYDLGGRRIELARLNIGDITVNVADMENLTDEDHIIVDIPMSKTDQEGEGSQIPLFAHAPDRADTCPVRAVIAWLDLLAGKGITDGPLLRVIMTGGRKRADGAPKTGKVTAQRIPTERVADVVERTARECGLLAVVRGRKRHIVPHSLRAGSATEAGEFSDTPALNAHFRWSPHGTTAQRYVRAGRRKAMNPVRRMYQERQRRRDAGQRVGHEGGTGE